MSGFTAANRGLHPSHYAALRTEILRTGAELSHPQLVDLTDALQGLLSPPPTRRRPPPRIEAESRAFA